MLYSAPSKSLLSSESRNPSSVLKLYRSFRGNENCTSAFLVLEQGYLHASGCNCNFSSDTKSGCWSLGTDLICKLNVLECQLLKRYQKINDELVHF